MKTKKLEDNFEKLSNDEMLKISGGTGRTKIIIIIDGEPTIIWV
jgi:hypothetical protein